MSALSCGSRVAIAGLVHESNSFAPKLTTYADFEQAPSGGIRRGSELESLGDTNTCVAGFSEVGEQHGWLLIPTIHAEAEPGGPLDVATFQTLHDELIEAVCASAPDAVYLDLHGAMLAEGIDDADAHLIEALKSALGLNVPIVASLDMHANVSPRLLKAATALSAFRTYPHVDMRETGRRTAACLAATSQTRSVKVHRYLPFMMPVNRQYTERDPMRSIYKSLEAIEDEYRDHGLIGLSLATGFQPADIEAPVPAIFALAQEEGVARRACNELYELVMAQEPAFSFDYQSPTVAAEAARRHVGRGPLIIADAQDNPGGGGSSDTMFILKALLAAGVDQVLLGMIHDPAAAGAAYAAGVGSTIRLSLGGVSVPGDSPLVADFLVKAVSSLPVEGQGAMLANMEIDIGPAALIEHQGIDIVVASKRTQCLDRAFFTHFGAEPSNYRVIVVKSAVHFRADFETLASGVIDVIAPGFEAMDFTQLPYRRLMDGVRFYGCGPCHRASPEMAQLLQQAPA